jgi:hypothetical protein
MSNETEVKYFCNEHRQTKESHLQNVISDAMLWH